MDNSIFGSVLDSNGIINVNNPSVIGFFQESFTNNWDLNALSDYQGVTYTYKQVAEQIEKEHIIYKSFGIEPGDKIAICAKNCANWAITFFSILTYGAVPVPILADFKADYIHNIVNHSEAKLLFVGDSQWKSIEPDSMEAILGIFSVQDFSLLHTSDDKFSGTCSNISNIYQEKYPAGLRKEDVDYYKENNPNSMAILNYTSGTTSFPKGVMIPYRALRKLITYSLRKMPLKAGSDTVCMLPLAHMFGLMFELIYDITLGCHIHFLTRIPSPKIIFQTFKEFKPTLIITVPLVIEKVVQNGVFPAINKPYMKMALHIPGLKQLILKKIRQRLIDIFGGKMVEVIIGGAALDKEVEKCLHMLKFPYSVGYGATECAPLIAYTHWNTYKPHTCGQAIEGVTVKVHSSDPENIPGEITVFGDNVMLGYYKNPEATEQTIDKDGWYHTGDIGVIDKQGFITIKGRSKNMILGPSGQNIYPEELEGAINKSALIAESLVVERDGKLVALVTAEPGIVKAENLSKQQIEERLEEIRKSVNEELPAYERISLFQVMENGFEKTPKGSIKRFLYQQK